MSARRGGAIGGAMANTAWRDYEPTINQVSYLGKLLSDCDIALAAARREIGSAAGGEPKRGESADLIGHLKARRDGYGCDDRRCPCKDVPKCKTCGRGGAALDASGRCDDRRGCLDQTLANRGIDADKYRARMRGGVNAAR